VASGSKSDDGLDTVVGGAAFVIGLLAWYGVGRIAPPWLAVTAGVVVGLIVGLVLTGLADFLFAEERLLAEGKRIGAKRRREADIARARALVHGTKTPGRQSIPRAMRYRVWERDGGRCVECGATFDLQYDHIIPLAMGVRTTPKTCSCCAATAIAARARCSVSERENAARCCVGAFVPRVSRRAAAHCRADAVARTAQRATKTPPV
jgi:hypothetical protein